MLRTPWLCGEGLAGPVCRARPPHVHRPATGPISTCGARGAFAFAASDAPSAGAHFAVDIGGKVVSWRRALRTGGFVGAFFLTALFPHSRAAAYKAAKTAYRAAFVDAMKSGQQWNCVVSSAFTMLFAAQDIPTDNAKAIAEAEEAIAKAKEAKEEAERKEKEAAYKKAFSAYQEKRKSASRANNWDDVANAAMGMRAAAADLHDDDNIGGSGLAQSRMGFQNQPHRPSLRLVFVTSVFMSPCEVTQSECRVPGPAESPLRGTFKRGAIASPQIATTCAGLTVFRRL